MSFGPVVDQFISATATGQAREIACFGTRGDGKTIGALFAMLAHAEIHKRHGFKTPAKWIGVADTFESHKSKTFESLTKDFWAGCWQQSDGGKVWHGGDLVDLHLFGVKDNTEIDRVRTETVGVWFEEPAPAAVLVQSSGLTETAWTTALTSQRIPTHAKVGIMTLNYPDEDHWTAQRFVFNPEPETDYFPIPNSDEGLKILRRYFRIPPGERATREDRAEWEKITQNRPDLKRRLLDGQFGSIMLGQQVAVGFNEDLHVSREPIRPMANEPLFLGQDFGHTPTCVIGQNWRGFVRIYAALTIDRGGTKQLYEQSVIPWLNAFAPWALRDSSFIRATYDPAAPDDESNIESNPQTTCEQLIGGYWQPGPVSWEGRKGPMLEIFNKSVGGAPALQINRDGCKQLIQSLSGRWYYPLNKGGGVSKDAPAKPNHPFEDYGDSFCYFLAGALPEIARQYRPRQQTKVVTEHRIFGR